MQNNINFLGNKHLFSSSKSNENEKNAHQAQQLNQTQVQIQTGNHQIQSIQPTTHHHQQHQQQQQQYIKEESLFFEKYNKILKENIEYSNKNLKFKAFLKETIQSYIKNDKTLIKILFEKTKENVLSIQKDDEDIKQLRKSIEINIETEKEKLTKEEFYIKKYMNVKYNQFLDMISKKEFQIRIPLYKLFYINHLIFNTSTAIHSYVIDFFRDEYLVPFRMKQKGETMKKSIAQSTLSPQVSFYEYLTIDKVKLWNIEYAQSLYIDFKNVTEKDNVGFVYKQLEILVKGSFMIYIKVYKSVMNLIKITIGGLDETCFVYNKILLCKMKSKDKSKYRIMNRLEYIIDDRIKLFIRYSYSNVILLISKYSYLFMKDCYYCRRKGKLNVNDNCIYPPILIGNTLDSDFLYHEGCFLYTCLIR